MRLYFFPALIPLAPLLPWLLTAVGAAAAGFQAIRRNRWLQLGAFLLFVTGMGMGLWQYSHRISETEGSRLTPMANLPRLEVAPKDASARGGLLRNPVATGFLEDWFQLTPRAALSSPVVAQGLILLGTREGALDAFSAEDGTLQWSLKKRDPVFGVGVSGSRAYVGEGLHTAVTSSLTTVSLPDGKPLWQREFLGHLESPPAVDDKAGVLWQGSGPSGLWALKTQDGAVVWRKAIGHIDTTPLLWDETHLYVPLQPDEARKESALVALNPKDGAELGRVALPGLPFGQAEAVRSKGTIALTTSIGQLGPVTPEDRGWSHLISADGLTKRWSVELPGMALLRSVVAERAGLVVHATKSGDLIALRLDDGKVEWRAKLDSPMHASPTLVERFGTTWIVCMTLNGNLSVRSLADGHEVQAIEVGRDSTSSPVFVNGVLFGAAPGMLATWF